MAVSWTGKERGRGGWGRDGRAHKMTKESSSIPCWSLLVQHPW